MSKESKTKIRIEFVDDTIEEYYDVESVYRSPTNYTIKFTDKSTFLLNPNYIKAIRVSNIEIDDEIRGVK